MIQPVSRGIRYNKLLWLLPVARFMNVTPLKKGQTREEDRSMWGFGRSPNPPIYPSPLHESSFFSALKYIIVKEAWGNLSLCANRRRGYLVCLFCFPHPR